MESTNNQNLQNIVNRDQEPTFEVKQDNNDSIKKISEIPEEKTSSPGHSEVKVEQEELKASPLPKKHEMVQKQKADNSKNSLESSKLSSGTRKEKLINLFWKYADISDETGAELMKSRQFIKILQDSNLIDKKRLTKSKAEVTFVANAERKGLTFEAFFNTLVKLAELRYPDIFALNKAQALEELVIKHFIPLHDKLYQETVEENKLGSEESKFRDLVYEEDIKIMLNSIFPVIKDIYDTYFGIPFQKGRDLAQISQIAIKQLLVFVRDFDLLRNYYISKQTAISMMKTLVKMTDLELANNPGDTAIFFTLTDAEGNQMDQNYGVYFTLNRFFIFLFWVSIAGFETNKDEDCEYTQAGIFILSHLLLEKLYFLLAKMELSKGFTELSKLYFKHYASPYSLIPVSSIINKLVVNNPLNNKANSSNKLRIITLN